MIYELVQAIISGWTDTHSCDFVQLSLDHVAEFIKVCRDQDIST